jgi:hypothetical protein
MCRYAISGPYKPHYACFKCRRAFKQWPEVATEQVCCPECGDVVHDLGLDFKPPKQANRKQWQKVRQLFEHGFIFHSCGCCGPGLRPEELKEVAHFLADNLPQSEGQRLLNTIQERVRNRRVPHRGTT